MLNLGLLKPEWIAIWDELTEDERQQVYQLINDDTGLSKYCPQEPTAKQWEFVNRSDLEVFGGGAAAGGKSSSLLMAALQYVDVPNYSAIIFRRTYADLSLPGAIMDRALSWLKGKPGIHWSPTDKKFTFPSGATLAFGYLDSELDRYRYQSSEFQERGPGFGRGKKLYIGFDELTQFSEKQYLYLFSRLRKLKSAKVPLRMRSASNPGGVGGQWVYERFVDPDRKDPARIFIPAKLTDNPHIDQKAYIKSLGQLDDVTKAQLLEGDWQISERGNIFPMWSDGEHGHHVITWSQFETIYNHRTIPGNWQMAIGHDWGSTKNHPAVVSWVARSAEGAPLEGAFFLFREQVFIGQLPSDVAEGIQDFLERDNAAHRVRMWRMSHEARSERDTYRRKFGLPFHPMKQGKHDGIAQLRYVLRLQDIDLPHPFKPWINGRPLLYLVVPDEQLRIPKDEAGLARHRAEFAAYRYTEPEVSQQKGQGIPVPFKLFDDAMDSCRGIFADWGPSIEGRDMSQEFAEALPQAFRKPPPAETPAQERDLWALAYWVAASKAKDRVKKQRRDRFGLDDEAEAEIEFEQQNSEDVDGHALHRLFSTRIIDDTDFL